MSGTSTMLSGVFAGRYVVERELGRGGTAIVYLARDQQRGHSVAIKVLRPEFAESLGADRFLKEIQLSQQLHHPHILPVLDSGKYEGQLYFVLPHMEGGTLRNLLQREKQLPLEQVIAITKTVAVALAHAHEKGLIHRDVKPENILFTSGQACLGDFGIARALERAIDDTTTSTSIVRGTPPYMSPEQASGERELDGRSDIYTLGCVVYEMLAGMQPFVGPTPQSVIAQRLTHAPRPIRVYRPGLPTAIEAVMQRALAVTRADRYQKATDFADALELAARTPDDPSRTALERQHRRMRYGALVAGVALAAAATIAIVKRSSAPRVDAGIPEGDPRRIAVLYLDDLTPSTVPAHVVDGVTEDLIDQLGSVRALHVISPNGVRPFHGSAVAVDSIRRALKVGTIVSGSVAKSGNTMRVNVRLIDAASGQQRFSQQLEARWTELFTLQDKLADQVAFFLRQRLGDEIALRANRATTKSYEAWDAAQLASELTRRALEGGMLRRDRTEPVQLLRADSLYGQAARFDPRWTLPIIRRGRLALALAVQSPQPPNLADSVAYTRLTPLERHAVWTNRAIQLADAALRMNAASGEALALRGEARYSLMYAGTLGSDTMARRAEDDLRAAVQRRPDLASAWITLAELSQLFGRFADAAASAQRAFEADAFFEERRVMAVGFTSALAAEQFDDARRWCRMGLDHYPGDPRFTECELVILAWTGRSGHDATTAWRLLQSIEQRDTLHILDATWTYRRLMVSAVLARAGMRDSARSVVTTVQQRQAADPSKRGAFMAEAYVQLLLGDREKALTLLGNYLKSAPQRRAQLQLHPWFRALRSDPRFIALVQPAP